MIRKGFRIFLLKVSICASLLLFSATAPVAAGETGPTWKEDINGDGAATSADVIALLHMLIEHPNHPRVDYNGDRKSNIIDALSLLINIAKGELHPYDPAAYTWQAVGFGGGGAMFIPAVDPHDPTHVFIASDMTGAFVTTDNGKSWRNFNLRTAVNDFEFDPSTPGTVYALNTGLYRSDDGGERWRLIYPTPSDLITEKMTGDHADQWFYTVHGDKLPEWGYYKVLADPADPEHIVIAKFPPWMGLVSLIASHDGGTSWRTLTELPGGDVLQIFPGAWWGEPDELAVITTENCLRFSETSGALDTLALPETPLIAASGGKMSGEDGGVAFYILAGKLYRSYDSGKSWSSLQDKLPAGASFNTLAICENKAEIVYLACSSYSDYQFGTLKSTDSGESWSWVYRADGSSVLTGNYSGSWMDRSYGPSWRGNPLSLGVSATDPNVCYATDYGSAYRTLDGGVTWEQVYSNDLPDGTSVSRGLNVTASYGVHFDPLDSLRILLPCTDVGMFASSNGGESWVHAVSGIPSDWANTCYWVAFDPEVKSRVWSAWSDCHDLPRPKMMRSGKLAAGGYYGGVAVSDNSGRSWRPSNSYMPANTVCTHILLDPTSPADSRTLYVCGFSRGVYKSTDGGRRWSEASNGIGENRNAWRIVRLPGGTLFLLVARGLENGVAVDGVLYKSDDQAANWTLVELPQGYNAPNDLAYDPSDTLRMYLCCWPTEDRTVEPWVERCGGLLRTEDGGRTWKQVFDQGAHVYASALDPQRPSTIIIGTFDSGSFRSDDRGESWYRLEGFNFNWGYRPVFDPYNPGMIYMTTFGGGVFHGPAGGVPGAFEDIENDELLRWQSYSGEANLKPE